MGNYEKDRWDNLDRLMPIEDSTRYPMLVYLHRNW